MHNMIVTSFYFKFRNLICVESSKIFFVIENGLMVKNFNLNKTKFPSVSKKLMLHQHRLQYFCSITNAVIKNVISFSYSTFATE